MFYPSQSQEICGPGRARLLLDSEGQKPKCNSIEEPLTYPRARPKQNICN